MKKSELRQIIREELKNEGWFDDMSKLAKQAYIKMHPDSKYAKNIKSNPKKQDDLLTRKQKRIEADKQIAKKWGYKYNPNRPKGYWQNWGKEQEMKEKFRQTSKSINWNKLQKSR